MPKNIPNSRSKNTAKHTPVHIILLMLVLSITFSLMLAEWGLSYQKKMVVSSDQMEPGMIQYDKILGWRLKPYWSGKHHNYDYDVSYTINKQGFRGREVARNGPSYAVIGDSFTFGIGVEDEETFVSLLDKNSHDKDGAGFGASFVNYSVPGYSTDQQLLSIKKLLARGDIKNNVLLVLYLGNDIFDNMRAYPLQADHGKPYFELINNKLVLRNTPVPLTAKSAAARQETISDIVLGKDSRNGTKANWFSQLELSRRLGLFQSRYVLTDEEMQRRFAKPLKLTSLLIDEMKKELAKNNVSLSVALLPGRTYVEHAQSLSAQYQEYFRQTLITSLGNSPSIRVIDLATQLRNLHNGGVTDLYFPNEGHLTKLGHQRLADYLTVQLSSANPSHH